MEIAQTIDNALFEWYSERGLEVPQWRMKKDPDWWTEYLNDLGIDPSNPQCYNTIIKNSTSQTTNPIHQSGIGNDT